MPKSGATSYKQTKFGILPRHEVIPLEVKATEKGMQLLQYYAKNKESPTPDFIKQIHKDSFAEILPDDAGTFRTIQVTYSSKEAPLFSQIPTMIIQLCDDTHYVITHLPDIQDNNYLARVVEMIAQFQHRFVFIHPFVDYNGRMARMLTNYLLMILNLPIIEIRIDNQTDRRDYITALQKADESDYSDLESILMVALDEGIRRLDI